jgi:ubiquinone/menaquinone biosynthesis C-methylase UbiE
MQKYYDPINRRLVFIKQSRRKADEKFWDSHWSHYSDKDFAKDVKKKNRFVLYYTNKYLPKGLKVLEGGCGKGGKVYSLHNNGYDAYGVDYATNTVSKVNQAVPELKITTGDVRKLDFDDHFFDGYWSLGVIEHFVDGYDAILSEMNRVIKEGGYLFLTVPSMSIIRKLKAALGMYTHLENIELIRDGFYQFAFSDGNIINDFTENGFDLIAHKPRSGLKGLKDEVKILQYPLQRLYDSKLFIAKLTKKSIDIAVRKIANHMSFFIFQRN